MAKPLVSVLMPCWNGAAFLVRALESLSAQSLRDFEVVAVDDGSTDDTPRVLEEWASREGRLRVERRQHQGIVAALNAGLRAAQGDPVAVGAAGARGMIREELRARGWREPEDCRTMA